jgi:hypothetical protein
MPSTPSMTDLVHLAGWLHFLQLPAMALFAPRILDWGTELATLSPINRRIVFAMGVGIMITIVGTGIVVISAPAEVAGGGRLGTALAGWLGIFFLQRLVVQLGLYARIWPAGRAGRLSHLGLTLVFAYLSLTYLAAAALALAR